MFCGSADHGRSPFLPTHSRRLRMSGRCHLSGLLNTVVPPQGLVPPGHSCSLVGASVVPVNRRTTSNTSVFSEIMAISCRTTREDRRIRVVANTLVESRPVLERVTKYVR